MRIFGFDAIKGKTYKTLTPLSHNMNKDNPNNLAVATVYYEAVANKDVAVLQKYLHEDIELVSPLAVVKGKEAVFEAIKNFASATIKLIIRAKFSSEAQAMIVYDVEFPQLIGKIRGAALMTIKNGLITKNELFYDARPFDLKQKEDIFGSS